MRRLQILASSVGARLFRQNSGVAWVGKVERGPRTVTLRPGDIVLRQARPFHAGHPGIADLGGWRRVTITPEMVGTVIAQRLEVEVKLNGRPTAEQLAWIKAVNNAGGRAGIVRSEEDLLSLVKVEENSTTALQLQAQRVVNNATSKTLV